MNIELLRPFFEGKIILIGVSASVAIYKILELISLLNKLGAQSKIVMSKRARKFINPILFEALSRSAVLCDKKQAWQKELQINHISYANSIDIALLAPASANTIAKIVYGIADNELLATFLALDSNIPKLIAPAMNTNMLNAAQTKHNLAILKTQGFHIIPAREGLLACGVQGDGAMARNENILCEILGAILRTNNVKLASFWRGKQVIITAGGSIEPIDEVRVISNVSSGKQGYYLALILSSLQAKVSLISSLDFDFLPGNIEFFKVQKSKEFKEKILEIEEKIHSKTKRANKAKDSINSRIFLFMSAAIADFLPSAQMGKIKKEKITNLKLGLEKNEDILSSIDAKKFFKVGFKAEVISKAHTSEDALKNARKMLEKKQCEIVCLNEKSSENDMFGSDFNQMHFLGKNLNIKTDKLNKAQIALEIIKSIFIKDLAKINNPTIKKSGF